MTGDASLELDLEPGDRYDEFEIVRVLGKGAFARVFEARSPDYDDAVALKLSRSPITSESMAIRALREIRILQNLRNPHVVHILDNGMGRDERWYMVMELLRGNTLLELHDFDRPMEPARATRLIYEACVGLDEAHEMGIVHRDVKPENLFILRDSGRLKVIDFGLARAWDPGSTIGESATVGHMLIGTPHYAQPEQVESGVLVPASDVYSLGIVLYELLAGRMPLFADEPLAAVRRRLFHSPLGWLGAHVRNELVPIDRYPEGQALPRELVDTLHWMLARDPERRPARGSVAAEHLAWVLHHHYGQCVTGLLRTMRPDGSNPSRLLLPGLHALSNAPGASVEIPAAGAARTFAKLHWLGVGHEAVLTPQEPFGTVWVNGHLLEAPVRLVPGTYFDVAGTRMLLDYPAL
ncbi:serine/threonine protein kinase [Pseudenhygromyxa sp. WMMC2535]|uniref:serine/threonine protein kinase n=1 Tax=Pseudenhygromyxa sp. WMMC2535 TaxID=2712867 RepID=UPI001555B75A|nr:serine/threonine-protein kinase [Pseudenhygromyxa sp. WMMC2535]NVB37633.1 serine/threonine protein kinase [Pseudenhygromyxa sp. WMMC2535]